MENTDKLLVKRLQLVQSIGHRAIEYFKLIQDIVMSINPTQYKQAMVAAEALQTINNEPSRTIEHSIAATMDIYQSLGAIDMNIHSIIEVVLNETYSQLVVYNMSATYSLNIQQLRNTIHSLQEQYLDMSAQDDPLILNAALEGQSPDELFAFIMANDEVINKFTIRLLGHLITTISGEKRRQIELIVEKQKDYILGSIRVDVASGGIQGMMVRYGLRPITPSMTPNEVFAHFGKPAGRSFADLVAPGVGVVEINMATPSPVEFSLAGLIDLDYIVKNDFKTNPLSGLTKKIIDRFSTATLLPRGKSSIHRGGTKAIHGAGPSWIVLQSINGDLWRVVGDKVPSSMISGLLHGVSTRPHQYNLAQTPKILCKCHNKRANMLLGEYEALKLTPPSSEPIRAAVLDKLTDAFDKRAPGLRTMAAVKAAAVDKTVISEVLLEVLGAGDNTQGKGGGEYLITHISKYDGIIYDFVKKLERQWMNVNLQDRVFTENTPTEIQRQVRNVFIETTRAAIDELEQARSWTDYDISLKEFMLNREQIVV